ncbi:hypothetical protein K7432_002826 [Basidiobolus ranarum]|uniref:Shugoshin N-terminal coiled-coil domain-containing protein n=1 Tax=Basidiobolus ranarum TaxID=34480 RepID=A0ABR2W735_9FUNG
MQAVNKNEFIELEKFKRKHQRQNQDLVRSNTLQALQLRKCELEKDRLLSENIELRTKFSDSVASIRFSEARTQSLETIQRLLESVHQEFMNLRQNIYPIQHSEGAFKEKGDTLCKVFEQSTYLAQEFPKDYSKAKTLVTSYLGGENPKRALKYRVKQSKRTPLGTLDSITENEAAEETLHKTLNNRKCPNTTRKRKNIKSRAKTHSNFEYVEVQPPQKSAKNQHQINEAGLR